MEHVPFQYEIGSGRLAGGDDVWSDLIQATNGLERGNLPYCCTWVHRSLHAWLRLATMAREEGRNRKRGDGVAPVLDMRRAHLDWCVAAAGGSDAEHLTCARYHSTHVPCRVVHAASIPEQAQGHAPRYTHARVRSPAGSTEV